MEWKIRPYLTTVFVAIIGLLAFTFCAFYLLSSHAYLQQWFIRLQPSFYESKLWQEHFFTRAAKQTGNLFCMIGIALTILLLILHFKSKRYTSLLKITIESGDRMAISCIAAVKIIQSWWASRSIYPYADEVFSSVHCVEDHPFHTLAYYMLPNNHVFYNLLNQAPRLFSSDPIMSGRALSGVFSVLLGVLLYFFFRQLLQHKLMAALLSVAVGLHFGLWGFSGMARGYELYLLCEWGAFIFIWQYFKSNHSAYLMLFALCCVVGFATIPTFLFFFGALLILILYKIIVQRKIDWQVAASLFTILTVTFLFYLPAICFSGLTSLLRNDYVRAGNVTYEDAAYQAYQYCVVNLRYCFTGTIYLNSSPLYTLLAAFPLLLLLRKNKLPGIFYLSMWLTVFIVATIMRQYPFSRVLSGQMSFTYAFLLLTAFYRIEWLGKRTNRTHLVPICFIVVVSLSAIPYLKIGLFHLSEPLYHKDVNKPSEGLKNALNDMTPGSKISISDQAFIMYYECQQQDYQPLKCGDATEPYRIQLTTEPLPEQYKSRFRELRRVNEFSIYQRY